MSGIERREPIDFEARKKELRPFVADVDASRLVVLPRLSIDIFAYPNNRVNFTWGKYELMKKRVDALGKDQEITLRHLRAEQIPNYEQNNASLKESPAEPLPTILRPRFARGFASKLDSLRKAREDRRKHLRLFSDMTDPT